MTKRSELTYSKEFKIEAVRLLELGDKRAAELAMRLGCRVTRGKRDIFISSLATDHLQIYLAPGW